MSGGSYNYAYERVQWFTDALKDRQTEDRENFTEETCDLRFMFAKHLERVSKAMRAIEWVDSGDSAGGSEVEAIKACMGDNS